jgi:5-methyltetrahydrofolate--homocysteine methyltransferase
MPAFRNITTAISIMTARRSLMAEYAVLARDAGVRIIGGCCGTMPEHLRAMRAALESRPKGPLPSADDIRTALGAFSSASDGTGEGSDTPRRERRGRRG